MNEKNFGIEEMQTLLNQAFAPWVQALRLKPVSVCESGAGFLLPENDRLSREGDILCGQAIAAAADTAGVLSLAAHNGEYRPLTTVDMTTHFMRPLMKGEVDVRTVILSNGRRMATLRVDFRQTGKDKICAGATCAYVYL